MFILNILYICFSIGKKTLPASMNRFNSLKHMQHFYVHSSNQKVKREKKNKEDIQCLSCQYLFNNTKQFLNYDCILTNYYNKLNTSKNEALKLLNF